MAKIIPFNKRKEKENNDKDLKFETAMDIITLLRNKRISDKSIKEIAKYIIDILDVDNY